MHNLLSRSQLDEWRHFENTLDEVDVEDQLLSIDNSITLMDTENQKLNDYYECLIECDALNQHECKHICRRILM
jgi:hypothetical protein|tara:strand:+ start:260 stop:481 length:222 start_codon:yes stop_codon:yes gene_type:complete